MHSPKDGFFLRPRSRHRRVALRRSDHQDQLGDRHRPEEWEAACKSRRALRQGHCARVLPGPSGGHVWPPWSYSPMTGLVYIPGTAGGSYNYQADPNFVPQPTDVGPTGRGLMNMGTGRGAGGGVSSAAARAGVVTPMLCRIPSPQAPTKQAQPAAPGPGRASPIEIQGTIGPDGPTGNVLYAWDPIAKKERWRIAGAGAGPFTGGTLATAGNLVLDSVNDRLMIFRADTGEKLTEINLGISQMGPPISFMLDGKQYITVTGAPAEAAASVPAVSLAAEREQAVAEERGMHPLLRARPPSCGSSRWTARCRCQAARRTSVRRSFTVAVQRGRRPGRIERKETGSAAAFLPRARQATKGDGLPHSPDGRGSESLSEPRALASGREFICSDTLPALLPHTAPERLSRGSPLARGSRRSAWSPYPAARPKRT